MQMGESKQLLFQVAALWEQIGEKRLYIGPEGVMVPPETFFAVFSYWEDGGQQLEDGRRLLHTKLQGVPVYCWGRVS